MNFFKKIANINSLVKGFNGTYLMINELESNINNHYSTDYSEFEEDLYILSYLCRNVILDKMELYNWSMETSIIVPMISKKYITIIIAYQQTIGRIYALGERLSVLDNVNNILDKGDFYNKIDTTIPKHIKFMFS